MAVHSPRDCPLKWESSPDAKAEKSRVTASEGTSGSTFPSLAAEIETGSPIWRRAALFAEDAGGRDWRDVEQFLDFSPSISAAGRPEGSSRR